MHKIYENDDLMMYFRKRYCHCCGNVLQRKKTEKIVRKSDEEHDFYCRLGTHYMPHGDLLVIGREYYCPLCNKSFTCEEQSKVIDAQKHYERLIVSEEEICNASNIKFLVAKRGILKRRWLLLIPIFGGLMCLSNIFNSCLREKTGNKDLKKLTLSSVCAFLVVAIIIKLLIHIANIDMLVKYQSIFILIPASLSFNILVLCYINHKFGRK